MPQEGNWKLLTEDSVPSKPPGNPWWARERSESHTLTFGADIQDTVGLTAPGNGPTHYASSAVVLLMLWVGLDTVSPNSCPSWHLGT